MTAGAVVLVLALVLPLAVIGVLALIAAFNLMALPPGLRRLWQLRRLSWMAGKRRWW